MSRRIEPITKLPSRWQCSPELVLSGCYCPSHQPAEGTTRATPYPDPCMKPGKTPKSESRAYIKKASCFLDPSSTFAHISSSEALFSLRNKRFLVCHSQSGSFLSEISPFFFFLNPASAVSSTCSGDCVNRGRAPFSDHSHYVNTPPFLRPRGNLYYRFHSSFSTLTSMKEFKSGQQVLWGASKDGETGTFSSPPSSSSSWKLGL